MLTIDDPEIERLIRQEAARTGEAPAAVLRRALSDMRASDDTEQRRTSDDSPLGPIVVRNGIQLLPRRPDDPLITPELVHRLLEGSE